MISPEVEMARTVIDIDDDALVRAAAVLGTTTKVDTVNQALRLVAQPSEADAEESREFRAWLVHIGERLAECDVRAEAWRDGTGRPSHLAEPWE